MDRFKSGAACTFKMRPTTTPSASTSKSSSFHSPRINEIPQIVEPDEAQRAALEELKTAVAKAVDLLKAGCPTDLPSTPTGRVEAMRVRLSAMLEAVRTVRAPLAKFYGLLNDEQKARFNAVPSGEDQNEPERRRNRYRDFAAFPRSHLSPSGCKGLSPDQRFLYSVHGDGDYATAFMLNGETGQAKLLNRGATGGNNGVRQTVDPAGTFLIVALSSWENTNGRAEASSSIPRIWRRCHAGCLPRRPAS